MRTTEIATFVEGLDGNWRQPWHTPPGGGITLLLRHGNEVTSSVRVVGNWITVRTGTSSEMRENSLSAANRAKLDKLLVEAK